MSILQNITNKIGNRSRSGDWFRTQLMEELDNDPNLNFNDMDTGGFSPGNLYQYTYNATTEQPYYDMYPLTYVIEMQPGGFLGCNLHYVKLKRRDDLAISLLNNSAQGAVAVLGIHYIDICILESEAFHIEFQKRNGVTLLNFQLKNLLICVEL